MNCKECGILLDIDDIGAHKKIINREATYFLCKQCLADYCECDVEVIKHKIQQFKDNGCLLFFPDKMPK